MKTVLFTFIVCLTMLVTACTPLQRSRTNAMPTLTITQPVEVVSGQGGGQAVGLPSVTPGSGGLVPPSAVALPASGVTLSENGMAFTMHSGESFLLNLGADVYEWTVEVDHQDVLQRKMGVAVIRGAQGIYLAHAPGTAKLTASGNPQCLNSTPPCLAPSILFEITVTVQ